jgi:hypothetical protein
MDHANTNANQNSGVDDPNWYFLAEFSPIELMSADDRGGMLTAGVLSQAIRELAISPEWVENVEMTLVEFAEEALEQYKHGRIKSPGWIRMFCQKKIVEDALTALTSNPSHIEPAMEPVQISPDSGANMPGGWGCFLIERGEDSLSNSSANPHNCIDLYIYREGN